MIKGIKEVHLWEKPSRIQSDAITYIMSRDKESKNPNKYDSLIAQARNGAGKSGAYVIGSLLRVDPKIQKIQVICIEHTRELVSQTTEVYEKVTRFAPEYKICNLLDQFDSKAQVIVTTIGKILNYTKFSKIKFDLSALRICVLDEVDLFFLDKLEEDEIMALHEVIQQLKTDVQYVFFSATIDRTITEKLSNMITEANQIYLYQEELKLDNVKQYYYKCKKDKKIQFVKDIFDAASTRTQTIIFVKTRAFAEKVFNKLKHSGYHPSLIMGGDMTNEHRDEEIARFRFGIVTMIITTDLLSRGFDMPTIQLVINFDVPQLKGIAQHETYLHRIGRAGRFGTPGMAITILDREEDEISFWETINFYQMNDKVQELKGGADEVSILLDSLKDKDA